MYEKIHRWTDEDLDVATEPEEREVSDEWDADADANDRLGIRGRKREITHIILGEE